MKIYFRVICFVFALAFFGGEAVMSGETSRETFGLPVPSFSGKVSIEETLQKRRSVRNYKPDPLSLETVSQLLWAAQGITRDGYYRTAPSAGALYPLETYLVARHVDGLLPGVYRYVAGKHTLEKVVDGDVMRALAAAAYGQQWFAEAPACVVLSAVYRKTTSRYGNRGIRYADMEAGHAAQNFALQAEAFGLGSVAVGAFDDSQVRKLLALPDDETPLYILPAGHIVTA